MPRSENARLSGCVYGDIPGRDLKSAVQDMQRVVAEKLALPPGYSISRSGQFEFLERATTKLKVVVPFTVLIVFVLLYLTFKRFDEARLIMATLPFGLVGGIWLLYLMNYNLSVAGAVGFVALAGVLAEFGVIMLLCLRQPWDRRVRRGKASVESLLHAIRVGAVLRVRHDQRAAAVDVCDTRRASADAAAAGGEGRPAGVLEVATCGDLNASARRPAGLSGW